MKITICHLYPKLMNIYSDMGNIICLIRRCQWRGIAVEIKPISLGQKFDEQKYDLVFGGGGQDRQQLIASQDLQTKKLALRKAVEAGVPMLTTCGTYQLFGHYFKTHKGKLIPGISIFNTYTIASDKRKIGNIIIKLNSEAMKQIKNRTIVGFENHSGNTFIINNSKNASKMNPLNTLKANGKTIPLGQVIKGFGNNGEDRAEGAIYKNCLGTYLHGPILPKNPHLADWLITTALERKYNHKIKLQFLDDTLEWQAHKAAIKRTYQIK